MKNIFTSLVPSGRRPWSRPPRSRARRGADQTAGTGEEGRTDGQQAHPVPAQGRVQVVGASAEPAYEPADHVSDAQPQPTQASSQGAHQHRERSRSALAGRRLARGGAAGLRLGLGRCAPARCRACTRGRRRGRTTRGGRRAPAARRRARADRAGGGAAGHPRRLSPRPTHPRDLSRHTCTKFPKTEPGRSAQPTAPPPCPHRSRGHAGPRRLDSEGPEHGLAVRGQDRRRGRPRQGLPVLAQRLDPLDALDGGEAGCVEEVLLEGERHAAPVLLPRADPAAAPGEAGRDAARGLADHAALGEGDPGRERWWVTRRIRQRVDDVAPGSGRRSGGGAGARRLTSPLLRRGRRPSRAWRRPRRGCGSWWLPLCSVRSDDQDWWFHGVRTSAHVSSGIPLVPRPSNALPAPALSWHAGTVLIGRDRRSNSWPTSSRGSPRGRRALCASWATPAWGRPPSWGQRATWPRMSVSGSCA